MSYQVLARKWRPKSFETLIGQDNTVQALSNALNQNRLHHAYLFTGTRGVGKTTLARLLAKSLNCDEGVSSNPCNKCSNCNDIDAGRFVDVIEVDAASNTGVDDMRELLENTQYATSTGKYKVYIIDEVHMLSPNAFNAMLKTLEEPPEHIKFILATTNIKKVPITILSRCILFNLKEMTEENVSDHLAFILDSEKIEYEKKSLTYIAKSSKGSMRDALSILDQAISYCSGALTTTKILEMLATTDESYLISILQALSENNGPRLLEITREMDGKSIALKEALNDLGKLIYEIAAYRISPTSFAQKDNEEVLRSFNEKFTPENIQMLYQIAITSRKDIDLAPDSHTGFSMAILRMLAFSPTWDLKDKKKIKYSAEDLNDKELASSNNPSSTKNDLNVFDGNWHKLTDKLKIGLAKKLAQECELIKFEDSVFFLSLDSNKKHLMHEDYIKKLDDALINYFNKKVKINIEIGIVSSSPAIEKKNEEMAVLKTTESAIMKDEFVNELMNEFGAKVIPTSIKPIKE